MHIAFLSVWCAADVFGMSVLARDEGRRRTQKGYDNVPQIHLVDLNM